MDVHSILSGRARIHNLRGACKTALFDEAFCQAGVCFILQTILGPSNDPVEYDTILCILWSGANSWLHRAPVVPLYPSPKPAQVFL